jgi:hypothetical protein
MLRPETFGTKHSASFFITLQISNELYGNIIYMERRRSKRKTVSLDAEIISDSMRCTGFTDNLSENGMYMRIFPSETSIDITPGTIFEIKLHHVSGVILHLDCRVLWSYKNPPHGLTYNIGLEIITPPQEYKTFIETLK